MVPAVFGLSDRRVFWIAAAAGLIFSSILVYVGVLIGAVGHPTRGEWMGFAGSIMGSSLSVVGALLVFEWQGATQRRERAQTLRVLLAGLKAAGEGMQAEDAPLNPVPRVEQATLAYRAVRDVAAELRSTSAAIAEISQMLETTPLQSDFVRLLAPGIGIATPDLVARGGEVVTLAERALGRMRSM